ncbi:MAG: Ger(x)C family spore germination protein [Caloramator sp.]|jgi:Ger(x)C family germination protein|uniref:Ger(x)C family spore germination protein n=1 Tax=Caloramator sp. TaxID=1871330 RepID=UPI001D293297|nr:Ger(x)C family spore germination protein [Caloramator sp.]MBZ4663974.1 Ger(x)C family spore germination protein [Caloramator sp.]
MKRLPLVFVLILCLLFQGCWDKVEIDERAFVGGIFIDALEEEGRKESKEVKPFYEEEMNGTIKVIFTLANPGEILKGGEKGYVTAEAEAETIPDAIRKIGIRLNRTPFFAHMKVVVLTDKVLKNEKVFKETVDFLERDPDINASVNIMMLEGDIEKLTKIKPKLDIYLVTYIQGVFSNASKLSYIVPVKLLDFISNLNSGNKAILPVITVNEDEVEIKNIALIKDNKLYKQVDEKYLRAFQFINGKLKGGRKFVNYKGVDISYFIQDNYRDIYVEDDNGKLKFTIKAELEGYLENESFSKEDIDKSILDDIESILSKSFELEMMETIKYFQDDIEADYLGLEDYTRKNYYKVYKKYKDNWDEAFKEAEFTVEAKAFIRRIGSKR